MADNGSGERTEKPTGKKIRDARDRGQVARSRDLASAASLAAVMLALSWFGVRMVSMVAARLANGLGTLADHARGGIEATSVSTLLMSDASLLVKVVGPPARLGGGVWVLASALQVGWAYSPKAVEFNWGRLSPASGLSRLAPMQALPELFKAVIGMVVVGTIGYLFIHQVMVQAPALVGMMPRDSAAVIWSDMWTLLWRSTLALIALAAADFGVQRWRWYSQLKMSRQEVREEARSNEGSPEIKARVRRVQRDMARNRMLTLVKTATVVITNPTHVAVALEYRRSEMTAPVVVAKGQDHMAARIREIAREHGVPIVENVTLARALHKSAEIGDTIPADLFGAVAEVLAYLVRLKQLLL
jgi:flagellar biosynthetic protein FlhB